MIVLARELYLQLLDNKDHLEKLFNSKNQKSNKELENIVLIPIEEHPFWQKIDTDPDYKAEVKQLIQYNLSNAFHTHKKYDKNFTNLKTKKH